MRKNEEWIAIYSRKSKFTGKGESIGNQVELCREYIRNLFGEADAEGCAIFEDEGFSGGDLKRPAFQRMIGHAKAGEFEMILVWKFSRFARNQEESILYKSMLSRSGVEVISISETLDDSPFSSLIERIIEWMDEYYVIRLSGEVKRGMIEKGKKGLGFAVGTEPLPAYFASKGCSILATDLGMDNVAASNWINTGQNASGNIDILNRNNLCKKEIFMERVLYKNRTGKLLYQLPHIAPYV